MIDSKLLEVYVNELKTKPETRRQYLPAFHDLLQMHISILHLIQSCVVHDVNVQGILLKDKQAMRQLVLLLGVAFTGKVICSWLQCFHKIKMDLIRTGYVYCHFGKSEDTLFRSENKLQDNMGHSEILEMFISRHIPSHYPTLRLIKRPVKVFILHRDRHQHKFPLGSVLVYRYLCLSRCQAV